MLEYYIPNYSSLMMGDTIHLIHEGKTYLLTVLETSPGIFSSEK